ncbi:putative UDP-glycosyltransferase 74F2-like [Capsicum annuum]|nr:putative UDP-glycosyltransferase 74F2-like [Capsicum annuum]
MSCSSIWNSSDQLEHAPSKKTRVESALKHHSDIKKLESEFQDQDSTSTLSTGQSNHVEAAMGKSKTVLQNLTAHPGWGGILDVQEESGTKASLSGKSATNTLPQPQAGGNISSYMVQHSESGSWGTSTQSGTDVTSIFNGDDMFQKLKTSCMLEPDSTLLLSMVAVPPQATLQMHSYWCTQMDNWQFILGYVTLPFPD